MIHTILTIAVAYSLYRAIMAADRRDNADAVGWCAVGLMIGVGSAL